MSKFHDIVSEIDVGIENHLEVVLRTAVKDTIKICKKYCWATENQLYGQLSQLQNELSLLKEENRALREQLSKINLSSIVSSESEKTTCNQGQSDTVPSNRHSEWNTGNCSSDTVISHNRTTDEISIKQEIDDDYSDDKISESHCDYSGYSPVKISGLSRADISESSHLMFDQRTSSGFTQESCEATGCSGELTSIQGIRVKSEVYCNDEVDNVVEVDYGSEVDVHAALFSQEQPDTNTILRTEKKNCTNPVEHNWSSTRTRFNQTEVKFVDVERKPDVFDSPVPKKLKVGDTYSRKFQSPNQLLPTSSDLSGASKFLASLAKRAQLSETDSIHVDGNERTSFCQTVTESVSSRLSHEPTASTSDIASGLDGVIDTSHNVRNREFGRIVVSDIRSASSVVFTDSGERGGGGVIQSQSQRCGGVMLPPVQSQSQRLVQLALHSRRKNSPPGSFTGCVDRTAPNLKYTKYIKNDLGNS